MTYKINIQRKSIVDKFLFWHHRKIQKIVNTMAEKYSLPENRVFEIGGGGHTLKNYFPNARFLAFDIELYPDTQGLGNIIDIPFRDEVFDIVLCNNVLEHIYRPDKAIAEMYRVLKNGGHLLMITPFLFPVHDPPYDFFRYSRYSLVKMLDDFSEINIKDIPIIPLLGGPFKRFVLYYVTIARK